VPERAGSLSILGNKLRSLGPPSIDALIAQLGDVEGYMEFVALVREFLPEREQDIIHKTTLRDQIATFATYFGDRYFPLDDSLIWDSESYSWLTRAIPVVLRSISWDDYHCISVDGRPGIQLMTYIVQDPYLDGETRILLAESCREHVPINLLQQVPEEGFSSMECHRILDKTLYKGLALWADIVWAETGNLFLDTTYDDIYMYEQLDWDRETVERLTQQWQQADMIEEEIINLGNWLEDDPPSHFEELVNFMLERR
jgi:hypothetical protein